MKKRKQRKADTKYLSRVESQMLDKFRKLTMEIELSFLPSELVPVTALRQHQIEQHEVVRLLAHEKKPSSPVAATSTS